MLNELDIVRDVSQRLEEAGLAYMLTGSMAMNYYAQPRMTRDIDLVVALSAADADTVVRTFAGDYSVSPVADSDARELSRDEVSPSAEEVDLWCDGMRLSSDKIGWSEDANHLSRDQIVPAQEPLSAKEQAPGFLWRKGRSVCATPPARAACSELLRAAR